MLEVAILLIFPALMTFAGAMDLFTMTIPNRVTFALVVAFPIMAPFSGMGWAEISNHLGAGLLMLVVGILMFSRGWLGGGDAKLLAAAALWFGFEPLAAYLVLVAIVGGVLACAIFFYRSVTPPLWLCAQPWAMRLHDKKVGIPYGIALSAAALWLYPSTLWFVQLSV